MKYLIITFLFFCRCLYAQDSTVFTLQQCIDIAVKNNISFRNAQLQAQRSKARVLQSEAALLPSVSGYANQGISAGKSINPYTNTFVNQQINTGQYGLNASLNLFSGLSAIHTIGQNQYTYKADQADEAQALIDLKLQVSLAYFQILMAEEQVRQAATQMELTQAQLSRLNSLNDNQAVSPSVLYDTKAQLANDMVSISNYKLIYKNAILNLSQLLNFSFPETSKFENGSFQKELPNSIAAAASPEQVAQTPMVKSAEYRRKSAYKTLQMYRGLILLTLSANGSIGSNYSSAALSQKLTGSYDAETGAYVMYNGTPQSVYETIYQYQSERIAFQNQFKNNLNTYVGLSLQIPLFNSLRNKTQISISKLNYKQAELQEITTENKFKNLIKQTGNELSNAYERYTIYEDQVKNYLQSFEVATVKFENGAINTYEYIMAKNNLEKSRVNLITARYDCLYKAFVLNTYQAGK